VSAQDFSLSLSDISDNVGSTVTSSVTLDITGPDSVQGWSYGICHDASAVTMGTVAEGATTLTVNAGGAPDFLALNDNPDGGDGYTCGVVIDFFGVASLAPSLGSELTIADYTIDAMGTSAVTFCDNLGNPAVESLVVVGGASIIPAFVDGSFEGVIPTIDVSYAMGNSTLFIDDMGGTTTPAVSTVLMTNDDVDAEIQGYSFAIGHDGDKLTLDEINLDGTVTADTNGGSGPEFFAPSVTPAGGAGGTIGIVVSLSPPFDVIAPGVDQSIANFVYSRAAMTANGDVVATDFSTALGSPPVDLVAVVDGVTIVPTTTNGEVTVVEQVGPVFVDYLRADTNGDLFVNIADGIWILNYLWQGGPESPCMAAIDANGDGFRDTSDAMYIIMYRLLDGPAPVGNFPGCDTVEETECLTPNCP
jgi:hypothetical protein